LAITTHGEINEAFTGRKTQGRKAYGEEDPRGARFTARRIHREIKRSVNTLKKLPVLLISL
jgi:hypothetical protein